MRGAIEQVLRPPRSLAENVTADGLVPAAVLIPLVQRPAGLTVLLTKRTDHLYDHPGQVSFPGGRVDAGDGSAVATALREAKEEIGLDPALVAVAGGLDPYFTGTGFIVQPIVGFLPPLFHLTLDPFEVAASFEVPLAFFLDQTNLRFETRRIDEQERTYPAFDYRDFIIWGATAAMIIDLGQRISAKAS